MKILYIGSVGLQSKPLLEFLHGRSDYYIEVINVGLGSYNWGNKIGIKVSNIYNNLGIEKYVVSGRNRWFKKAAYFKMIKGRAIKRILKVARSSNADLILSSWGRTPLPELEHLQREVVHTPTIHDFKTYPVSTNQLGVALENAFNRRSIESLDGKIFPTRRMANYVDQKFSDGTGESLIFAEYIMGKMFAKKRNLNTDNQSDEYNIVFLGKRARNIGKKIEHITRNNIHIYLAKTVLRACDIDGNNNYIHTFDKFEYDELRSGEFSNFMSRFDASILLYPSSSSVRFENTIPERLIWSIVCGLPILIPKCQCISCEEYILREGIGFVYDNIDRLIHKIKSTDILSRTRVRLHDNLDKYKLENNFHKLDDFFRRFS